MVQTGLILYYICSVYNMDTTKRGEWEREREYASKPIFTHIGAVRCSEK